MTEQELEIVKLLVSVSTPLIILILGVLINRTLEKSKATLSKEQDWQNWWAGQFLKVSHNYNSAVSELITNIQALGQIDTEKKSGWEEEFKQMETSARGNIRLLQYLDWEIQNYIQFAPSKGIEVKNNQKELFNMLGNLIKTRQENLENIRLVQFAFNESVRLAHAEILEISPNKALQQTSR